MPKVTEAYREARREEIARAALRCLERKGVHDTSIADIVEESGLSTGAIYSHFTNKAELAKYIVGRYLIVRIDALEAAGRAGVVQPPRQVLGDLLGIFAENGLPERVVVQFWGEAMADAEIHAAMASTAGHLSASLRAAVTPWTRQRLGYEASESTVAEHSARTARTIASLAQGYIANVAVFGHRDVAEYVASLVDALRD